MKKIVKLYVGIDFAKEKFDVCCLDGSLNKHYAVFQNVKKDFRKFISWVKKCSGIKGQMDPAEILFCGEHTGECSLPLSEWLVQQGYSIWLENALAIKRSSGISRGKSDRADAQMIASYAMEKYKPGESRLFKADSAALKELRSLYFCREGIVKERVAIGNRISSGSFSHSQGATKALKKLKKGLEDHENDLEKQMRELMENSEELKTNYALLMSFKGIGPLTAAMFIIFTSNFTRFDNARNFACQCGVAPFGKDSGNSIHVSPHVSNYAHKHAKAALVQSAKSAIMHNPAIKRYAERLKGRGKPEGVVMNNVKNKIIHIVFTMIERQQPWDREYEEKHMPGKKALELYSKRTDAEQDKASGTMASDTCGTVSLSRKVRKHPTSSMTMHSDGLPHLLDAHARIHICPSILLE